jgi:O-methyltransferase involved in polyketide biosynthesis
MSVNARAGVVKTSKEALNCKSSATYSNSTGCDEKTKKQSPLMNKVYSLRSNIMHKIVKSSVEYFDSCKAETQLLILGAGLDTSYDKYSNNVFVVDFPEVINQRSESDYVTRIGVDMTDVSGLVNELKSTGFKFTSNTVILVECVLCYIDETSCYTLLNTLSSLLRSSLICLYDPMLETEGLPGTNRFSQQMRNKFAERGAPLKVSRSFINTQHSYQPNIYYNLRIATPLSSP